MAETGGAPDRNMLGGPEVSFDVAERLEKWPFIDGVMYGEGEDTFREMMACWNGDMDVEKVLGIGHRHRDDSGIGARPAAGFMCTVRGILSI